MNNCPSCGKENADGTMFCKYCGYYYRTKQAVSAEVETGNIETKIPKSEIKETDKPENKKSNNKIIAAIIIIVCVLLLGPKVKDRLSGESGDALYPKIIGNNINNLIEGSSIDPSAKKLEIFYNDPSNNTMMLRCLSVIDNVYYALNGSGEAVTFNVSGDNVQNMTQIQELSEFDNINCLFVSKAYYFVQFTNQKLYSVSREDGSVKQCSVDLGIYDFTFTENGKLCFIDWNGQTGLVSLYCLPAGAIDQTPEKCCTFMNTFSGSTQSQIFYGGDDIVYIYLWSKKNDANGEPQYLNKLYCVDMSKDKYDNPEGIDLSDNGKTYFTCDGENIFYCSFEDDDKNNSTIGILDPDTGEKKSLKDLNKYIYALSVYPDHKGKFSVFVGDQNGPDGIVTVP